MFIVFFYQAEDGIRDYKVTGVQTCALPISRRGKAPPGGGPRRAGESGRPAGWPRAGESPRGRPSAGSIEDSACGALPGGNEGPPPRAAGLGRGTRDGGVGGRAEAVGGVPRPRRGDPLLAGSAAGALPLRP